MIHIGQAVVQHLYDRSNQITIHVTQSPDSVIQGWHTYSQTPTQTYSGVRGLYT